MTKKINDWHPFAQKFPALTGEEWEAFKADIQKAKGNHVPVIYRRVKGKAQGLDGRNRYRACEELGIKCRMEEVVLKDDEIKDLIIRLNVRRRHLTAEMRRELVTELRGDGRSERQIAETLGISKGTVHRDIESTGPFGPVETVIGKDGKQRAATQPRTDPPKLTPSPSVLCPRCSKGGPVQGCQACREMRISRKPAAPAKEREPGEDDEGMCGQRKPTKNGQPSFSLRAFNELVARTLAELDKIPEKFGLVRQTRPGLDAPIIVTPEHQAIIDKFKDVQEDARKWLQQLEKKAKSSGSGSQKNSAK